MESVLQHCLKEPVMNAIQLSQQTRRRLARDSFGITSEDPSEQAAGRRAQAILGLTQYPDPFRESITLWPPSTQTKARSPESSETEEVWPHEWDG